MKTIIKQSADGIILSGDNNFDTKLGKVFINHHEITDIDTFFKVAEENTRLLEQCKKQKEVINKITEIINYYGVDKEYNDNVILRHILKDMLDILNEVSE